ncbi:uncharacterized protein BDZ99DRAFT_500639 [Mytilinidion resinicola]|uniref:UbiA prenyltransferase n=1 Tax=Mytilinidion resinicola TaxID=574789 RepID=A0A6A6YFV3_9PEZI|nr:uncharacterized protein BDZ99DRAFT_500639 [Mytilinidion resinicola]KAF2807448.1 hypothetical protein BDZ99DRAFT_500639 [Mytilinidion resinicola]
MRESSRVREMAADKLNFRVSGSDGCSSDVAVPQTSVHPQASHLLRTPKLNLLSTLRFNFYNLYLITIEDTPTFILPNTIFGLSSALTPSLTNCTSHASPVTPLPRNLLLQAVIHTLLFNWTNLLLFDLSNQRLTCAEDRLNKPWRPIPSGRMTAVTMRRWLICCIPLVLAYNHFILSTGGETAVLIILTWCYNDLGGGDENWLVRNGIIACAFGGYNLGSLLRVSAGTLYPTSSLSPRMGVEVSHLGLTWTTLVSTVIFSTMHVQDMKDVAGDLAQGCRSLPIVYGRQVAGWSVAVPWWCGRLCVFSFGRRRGRWWWWARWDWGFGLRGGV